MASKHFLLECAPEASGTLSSRLGGGDSAPAIAAGRLPERVHRVVLL